MEKDGFGRMTPVLPRGDWRKLEVLLDRSWEKESITWNGLTWWDPLPCGRDFVVQVARYLQPSLPSPALSLLGNPPTPQVPKSSLESYPARLQTRNLSISFSPMENFFPSNASPESCQSVFSTSPDFAYPPTPSSSPPLLNRPDALMPATEPTGMPTPPDSLCKKVQALRPPRPIPRRRIFDFPSVSNSLEPAALPAQFRPFSLPPPLVHLPPPCPAAYPPPTMRPSPTTAC